MPSLNDLKKKIVDEIAISEVIGRYLQVTRRGNIAKTVCPFHDDHDPSMNVTDSRRRYKCFACGAGGNAIDFVMNYKNLSFMEALKEIANNHGLVFDDFIQKKNKSPRLEMAEKLLRNTSKLYVHLAQTNQFPKYAEFISKRGLSKEIATTYSLGYAPANNALINYLNSIPKTDEKALAIDVALEVGLIKIDMKDSQSHYDTFRDRVMFPIWDQYGQVIGFTGRSVHDYQKAKYMNSKESFIFNKRHLLYGLHLAKPTIRAKDAVVLVEGNMDQVALSNFGFVNSVAIMGIALGSSSLRNIAALTKNFILALDTDNAGWEAAQRVNKQCLEAGIIPRFIDFSPHKDPDDFLQAEGAIALQKKIDEARTFIDVEIDKIMPEKMPDFLDRQLELLNKCFEVIAPLGSGLGATERAVAISKRIGLKSDSSQIIENYKSFLSGEIVDTSYAPQDDGIPPTEEYYQLEEMHEHMHYELQDEILTEQPQVQISKTENVLITELVLNPDCLTRNQITELLDFVGSNEVKRYISSLKELIYEIDEKEYVSVLSRFVERENYSVALKEIIFAALRKYQFLKPESEAIDKLIFDIKKKLMLESLKEKKEKVKARKSDCNSEAEMNLLMNELLDVEKEIIEVRTLKRK